MDGIRLLVSVNVIVLMLKPNYSSFCWKIIPQNVILIF